MFRTSYHLIITVNVLAKYIYTSRNIGSSITKSIDDINQQDDILDNVTDSRANADYLQVALSLALILYFHWKQLLRFRFYHKISSNEWEILSNTITSSFPYGATARNHKE